MKFFDDIAIGERVELGQHTFSDEAIKAFARRFDPQAFHLDEAAAARSHFGALCASGWHTASMWMRLMVEHQRRDDAARRARGEPVAPLGPSPGFRELKWLKPVYVGDTITYAIEMVEARASNSRPDWGLITLRNTGVNQKGEPVISFVSVVFVERRNNSAKNARKNSAMVRMSLATEAHPTGRPPSPPRPRSAAPSASASGAHVLHDGYTDLIYVMLPIWQAEFGLGYAALGLLRTCYAGTMAALQIPSALLSERLGVPLGAGRGHRTFRPRLSAGRCQRRIRDAGDCAADRRRGSERAASARLGAGSARLRRSRSMKALGAYNFAGDIGKMTLPALASHHAGGDAVAADARDPRRLGFVAAVAIIRLTPRFPEEIAAPYLTRKTLRPSTSAAARRLGFPLLLSIGMVDSATRMAFLIFLPFVLSGEGREPANRRSRAHTGVCRRRGRQAGLRLHRCAHRRDRDGLPDRRPHHAWHPCAAAAAARIRDVAASGDRHLLNGTSSVLYGSVPELVEPAKRARAFSVFYTGTIGAGAVAPALYGLVGDASTCRWR